MDTAMDDPVGSITDSEASEAPHDRSNAYLAESCVGIPAMGLAELRQLQEIDDCRLSTPTTAKMVTGGAAPSSRGEWLVVGSLPPDRRVLQSTRVPGLTVVRQYLDDTDHHNLLDCADAILYSPPPPACQCCHNHDVAEASAQATEATDGTGVNLDANQAVFLGADGFPALVGTLAACVARDLAGLAHTGHVWERASPVFNHGLINEYYPGDGIKQHVDLPHRFADGIVGISLGAAIVFWLTPVEPEVVLDACVAMVAPAVDDVGVLLLPGDLYALEGDARWKWAHRIEPIEREEWQGVTIDRGRR